MGKDTMVHLPTESDCEEAAGRTKIAYTLLGDAANSPKVRNHNLGGFVDKMSSLTIVLVLYLMAFYALIFLNWTFTLETFGFNPSGVAFYDATADTYNGASGRYTMWWWLAALTLLRLISVVGTFSASATAAVSGKTGGLEFMRWWCIIYCFVGFGLSAYYLYITSVQAACGVVQFCRLYDTAPNVRVSSANVLWHLFVWTELGFAIVHLIYAFLINGAIERVHQITMSKDDEED